MFIQNQLLKEKAEKFRLERIEKSKKLYVFPNLDIASSMFVQIIPFGFLNDQMLDISAAENTDILRLMKPMFSSGYDRMFNLDGFATFSRSSEVDKIGSYNQLFRNGVYEIYTSQFLQVTFNGSNKLNTIFVDSVMIELFKRIKDAMAVLGKFKVEQPFIICVSLHRIFGAVIKGSRGPSKPFTIDEIILPPIVLPNYQSNLYEYLKPALDMLWQTVGMSQSWHY